MSDLLTEADLLTRLEQRYCAPAFAFLPQVRNGTGYQRTRTRTADAMAMSLYPSRGLHLLGFEVKSHRGDWLRELRNPEKAEDLWVYCNSWWVVVGHEKVVQPGELPDGWGLIVPKGAGLRVAAQARHREDAKDLDRLLFASLCRNMQGMRPDVAAIEKARAEGVKAGEENREARQSYRLRELVALEKKVEEFERASGIQIRHGWNLGDVGVATRLIANGMDFGGIRNIAARIVDACDQASAIKSVSTETESAA
jgi:hypothetical protein